MNPRLGGAITDDERLRTTTATTTEHHGRRRAATDDHRSIEQRDRWRGGVCVAHALRVPPPKRYGPCDGRHGRQTGARVGRYMGQTCPKP